MVGFIGKQNNFFSFVIARDSYHLVGGMETGNEKTNMQRTSGERKYSSLRSENHRNVLPSKVRQLLP